MSDRAITPGFADLHRMCRSGTDERAVDWRYHVTRYGGGLLSPFARFALHGRVQRFSRAVASERARIRGLSKDALTEVLLRERPGLSEGIVLSHRTCRVVAISAELARHTLGLDAFPAQIRGVAVLLSGRVAEMPTGSGKTLTAALAAIAAAHGGRTVHVITANDYLAARDATELAPLYEAAALTVGLVANTVPQEARRAAYRADVVYASNKEITFDYLRNRIALGGEAGPVRTTLEPLHSPRPRSSGVTMTGLPFAIVDEADSVLIDECRTPLIVSADAQPDPETAHTSLALADALEEGRDYSPSDRERTVRLTDAGRRRLAEQGETLGGIWRNAVRREEAARQGLVARRYFQRDEHYIVREDKLELVDEYTGRVAKDRALGDGLHQVLQAKEGVTVTGRRFTQGRITYQRFFRRYGELAGMTGTAREVAGELRCVYGTDVLAIRPHHESRRIKARSRIFRTEERKWAALAQTVKQYIAAGRAVLIATRTVRASETVSECLTAQDIAHRVLNATQDAEEADIIAQAGQPHRVTVATNMAGRGVDIRLDPSVEGAGGLHVILTELHEAGRIDRQAIGRSARQDDQGSYELLLSWEDPLIEVFGDWLARRRFGGLRAFRRAQRRAERLHARARLDLLRQDARREEQLTFTGRVE